MPGGRGARSFGVVWWRFGSVGSRSGSKTLIAYGHGLDASRVGRLRALSMRARVQGDARHGRGRRGAGGREGGERGGAQAGGLRYGAGEARDACGAGDGEHEEVWGSL